VAEVFFETIYKIRGLPERIISDHDKVFMSIFWQSLHKLTSIELKMSTAYHPQTDGVTETANRTIMQMVRQAIGGKDGKWLKKLMGVKWVMNAVRSETTGFSSFFLNYGYQPRPLLWNSASKNEYPGVRVFAQKMKDTIMVAHDSILEKQVRQTRSTNKHWKAGIFKDGDLVYLSMKNLSLPKKQARKLAPKYIGPYKIVKTIVEGTMYKQDLPNRLKERGVHPTFHVSLLRAYICMYICTYM
jgi:hypothetical protein